MSAINFVVRTSTGPSTHGAVSANGENAIIDASGSGEISLNLRQADIRGYQRAGNDLEITLADGRVIVLTDYFGAEGNGRLFISADGYLNEVVLTEDVDGTIYAQYGPTAEWSKWSPSDELIFLDGTEVAAAGTGEEEASTMLGAGLLGLGGGGLWGAGAAGAAVVAGGALLNGDGTGGGTGTGGGGGGGRIPPTIDQDTDITLGGDGLDASIDVSGTAQPGSTVEVTIGDKTQTTTSDENGKWETTFEDETFPSDGTHDVTVKVTEPDGTETTLTGPEVVIDTTPPAADVTEGTIGAGDYYNADDFAAGVDISGTSEPGATITVTVDGVVRETTVAGDGSWSVRYEPGTLEGGERIADVSIVSSDAAGNTTTITDGVRIDTVPNDVAIDFATIEGDGIVNHAEAQAGIDITGTATPGASVVVAFNGGTQTVTAGSTGAWTATFDGSGLASGQYDMDVTATSTDDAGNVNSVTGAIRIDTLVQDFAITSSAGGADGVINAAEAAQGLTVSGTGEPGMRVDVTLAGQTVQGQVAADGSWTASFAPGQIPAGTRVETMTATATDMAGNVAEASRQISLDTDPNTVTINTATVEGDGIVNGAEARGGIDITGSATPGASVVVGFNGGSQTVIAGSTGAWTATFAGTGLAQGAYDMPVTASSTDAAGNTASTSGQIHIDTRVENFTQSGGIGGADGVINAAEAAQGLTVSGTGEPGMRVDVTLAGRTVQAQVAPNGNWTASFAASQIPVGTRIESMTATATDRAGNTQTITTPVDIDTEAGLLTLNANAIGGDGTINFQEARAGVLVTGQAPEGMLVTVTLDGVQHQVMAGPGNVWRTTYQQHEIRQGEYMPEVSASITDAAGNTARVDATVHVDTQVDNLALTPPNLVVGSDGVSVINDAVARSGFNVTGTVEPGSTVMVTVAGVARAATVDPVTGNWTARFEGGSVRGGQYDADITVDVVDDAGNVSQVGSSVRVDTFVDELTRADDLFGSDRTVNAAEAQQGVRLTGEVEPGSTVRVDVLGRSYSAVVAANGAWTLDIPAAHIPVADQSYAMTVTATDAARNTTSITDTLDIDTTVPDHPDIVGYFREGGGYRSVTMETSDDDITISSVGRDGRVTETPVHESVDSFLGETDYHFLNASGGSRTIPDGSQLIVTNTDAAGNASSTYVVLDETATDIVNISNPNLQGLQIEAIDLSFGDQSKLTLTEDIVKRLSETSDTVVVHGGADDHVTMLGAVRGGSVMVDGASHTIYTLGDSAQVLLDDEITNVVI
ncbi:Ig-like domain-containing protein [Roseovarius aquimarinus]|uniref:Ig-like domain-containing protein n=1 Tax=Roseovarius aquimarinus TaxID=1229156 RepID=A0ABW7I4N1_9RHOB